jgi:hypothetical protein
VFSTGFDLQSREITMGKFLGWLGGILAAVIAGYAIWYFTRPAPTTTFEGMVINGPQVAPLANAIVSVEFAGGPNRGPFHDFTDEHGAYRLDFTGLGEVSGVTIAVQAKGFQTAQPASLRKITADTHQDFVLIPEGAAAPPPPPPPGGVTAVEARPPMVARMPVYVQKPAAKAFRLAFQAKQ